MKIKKSVFLVCEFVSKLNFYFTQFEHFAFLIFRNFASKHNYKIKKIKIKNFVFPTIMHNGHRNVLPFSIFFVRQDINVNKYW